jgi:hypothetical protein
MELRLHYYARTQYLRFKLYCIKYIFLLKEKTRNIYIYIYKRKGFRYIITK